jgi:hypothetical protein
MSIMTAKFTLTFFDAGSCEERSVTLPLTHGDPSAGLLSCLDREDQQQVECRFREFVQALSVARGSKAILIEGPLEEILSRAGEGKR